MTETEPTEVDDLPVEMLECENGHQWKAKAAAPCPHCRTTTVYVLEDSERIPV